MKLRKRFFKREPSGENFWPSFTDMVSTIALVLFFLMLMAYLQNIITGKQVLDTQQRLEESKAEISQAEDQLRLLKDELDQVHAEVRIGEIALTLSQEEIEHQREIIANSNRELGNLRAKLQGIALLRLDVLTQVKDSVEGELGSTTATGEPLVTIGDTGNIIINEGLVFDTNSYSIKAEGRELLDDLAIAFERVLDHGPTRTNIDAVNIQGHTDDVGTAAQNRILSARRATAVVDYLMASNPSLERKYASYFMASGYSKFRPIVQGTSVQARAQNRRIEIAIILKDGQIQNVINEYLEDSLNVFNE